MLKVPAKVEGEIAGGVRDARGKIDSGAHGPPVKIRAAAGLSRRQPQHRHDRLAAVQQHADVGNTLKGNRLERRMEAHAVLNDGLIGPAAERVHAT